MRVLMFGWEFPPHNSGGLGVACQGLANALSAKKIQITFVLPHPLDSEPSGLRFVYPKHDNITSVAVDSIILPYMDTRQYCKKILSLGESAGNYGRSLFEEVQRYRASASRIAQDMPHDIIHAHDWLSFGAGIEAKSVSGKPLIAHVHATEVDRTAGNPNSYIYDKEKEGVAAADKVLAVSNFTKKTLCDKYGLSHEGVEVVYNGIDKTQAVKPTSSDNGIMRLKKLGYKFVLYVGRITIMKGVDYLLEAAGKVLQYNPKVIFVIAGAGDMEGQIMSQAARLGISDKLVFAGFLREGELSAAYKSADIFVMPSVSEPFGLVALESLAHGTPVIVSKQSGVSEVIKSAMRVDFWDTEEMADKIISVISHNSLRQTLLENGTKELEQHSWNNVADRVLRVYKNLISN